MSQKRARRRNRLPYFPGHSVAVWLRGADCGRRQGAAIVVKKITVDITLPVLNEERTLESNARILLKRLASQCDYDWSISIVDNGSTDSSWEIAQRVARTELNVRALRLLRRG